MDAAPQFLAPDGVQADIDALVTRFFGAFCNLGGRPPEVDALYAIFTPQALITRRSAAGAEPMTVAQFVEPRRALLVGGRLTEFREWEVSQRTEVFCGIAQRLSVYAKAGLLGGAPFEGRGVKLMQLALTAEGWKICALAWEDEREGPSPGG